MLYIIISETDEHIGFIHLLLGCRVFSADLLMPSRFIHEGMVYINDITYLSRPNMSLFEFTDTENSNQPSVSYQLPQKVKMATYNENL